MTSLAVVIPSWSAERAFYLAWDLIGLRGNQHPIDLKVIVVGVKDPSNTESAYVCWIEPDYPLSPVEAMALGTRYVPEDSEVIAFLHDDMTITESGWDVAILDYFRTHPRCGLVGFGGGTGFADSDLYKLPYDYRQLARLDFVSNMRDAHLHGRRVTEATRVAALDGFALITSREFYDNAGDRLVYQRPVMTVERPLPPDSDKQLVASNGAWAACERDGIPFHMYDAWISCRAAELGYETWMLPIECHHEGGSTSVGRAADYAKVVARLGFESPEDLYAKAHRVIYDRFSRVLPIRILEESR